MRERILLILFILVCLTGVQAGLPADAFAKEYSAISVLSEKMIPGFIHPESVAYDPKEKVLYVGQFGSELKPLLKDGKGKISKVSLTGTVLEEQCFAGITLHKPKGIWIEKERLWTVDIDVVWIFDLKSRQARKVKLPGAAFANDPTVINNELYVSDTGGNRIYKIKPADFLDEKIEPAVSDFASKLPFGPNGLCPSDDGSLIVVGYEMDGRDRGIYSFELNGKFRPLSGDIGLLDGVVFLQDKSILITDWKTKSLLQWKLDSKIKIISAGFMGPADFCIVEEDKNLLVVVPDLANNELRLIRLLR